VNDKTYGATVTLVDCSALDDLASVCRTLFDRYRSGILNLDGKNVQYYDRRIGSKYYNVFFDLKDIVREAGATESDLATLQAALDKVVVFERHTPSFMINSGGMYLDHVCGLSMYLPAFPDYKRDSWHGTEFLDGFYKSNVSWNDATGLVE